VSHHAVNVPKLPSVRRTVNVRRTVLIERDDNRFYNSESIAYVSLTDIADMLVKGLRIIVEDAITGEDVTSEVLDMLH
jgi:polyhydroxyalkanoate synthesis regulator protein